MDNQLYLPEPPALQKADMREMELLKERKQFRQQTHAEDLSDDEDFLRQVDYSPRAM